MAHPEPTPPAKARPLKGGGRPWGSIRATAAACPAHHVAHPAATTEGGPKSAAAPAHIARARVASDGD